MNAISLARPAQSFGKEHTVLIIGAGIAGCTLADALAHRGYHSRVFDQKADIASGASAVPVAVHQPHVTATPNITTGFFQHALATSSQLFKRRDLQSLYQHCGLLKLLPADVAEFTAAQSANHRVVDPGQGTSLAGTPIARAALHIAEAGWLNPQALGQQLCAHENTSYCGGVSVSTIRQTQFGWQLLNATNDVIDESAIVVFANACNAGAYAQCDHLPLLPMRGQISCFETAQAPACIVSQQGYIVPGAQHIWCGATYQRDTLSTKTQHPDEMVNRNRATTLCPKLPVGNTVDNWAGVRCTTPDRLPVVGALPDKNFYCEAYKDIHHGRRNQRFPAAKFHEGLFAMTAMGSRGLLQAAYSAELVSGLISGDENLNTHNLELVHPARFIMRALRRGQVANG